MIEPGFSSGTMRMHRNASLTFATTAAAFCLGLTGCGPVSVLRPCASNYEEVTQMRLTYTDQTGGFALHPFSFDFASWICSCVNRGLASILPMILPARLRLRQ